MLIDYPGKAMPLVLYNDKRQNDTFETPKPRSGPAIVFQGQSINFERTNRLNPSFSPLELIWHIHRMYADHPMNYLPNAISSSYVRMFE